MKDLLQRAAFEIRDLRRQNEILRAKVEMIDLFSCVLFTKPAQQSQGMSEDIAWQIDKKIAELDAAVPTP